MFHFKKKKKIFFSNSIRDSQGVLKKKSLNNLRFKNTIHLTTEQQQRNASQMMVMSKI